MKTNNESKKLNVAKKFGYVGVLLCGACCALPLLPFIGAGMAATLGFWFEKIGLGFLIGAAVFFAIYFLRRQRRKACSTDCECKDAKPPQAA